MSDGWYADPWNRWPERYFQGGYPTPTVRNGRTTGFDPVTSSGPPPGYGPYAGYPPPAPKAGDARTGPLPLHPMSMGDIIDGAFRLFRANFRTIVIVITVVAGPLQLIAALARRSEFGGNGIFSAIGNPASQPTAGTSSPSTSLIAGLIGLILLPYAGGAISRVVAASYVGSEITPRAALGATLRRVVPLFVAWLLIHLLELVGFVLLIVPGLIVMSLSLSTAPAIVLEELGAMKGIRRSWRLNRPRLWRIMGIALLSGLMVSFVGSIVAAPLELAGYAVGLRWGWILVWIGSLAGQLVTLSLTAIIATLIYFDGRIRHEGFDLQLLARGIGA